MMCMLWCRVDSCWLYGWLLYIGSMWKFGIFDEQDWNVLVIWMVSLWVGVRIRVWGLICCRLMLDSIGSVNVVVLLVLVWVWFSMLWFFSIVGMVVVWIGDGVLQLMVVIVCIMGLDRLSCVNCSGVWEFWDMGNFEGIVVFLVV